MVNDRECYVLRGSYILSQKAGGFEKAPIYTVCEIPPSCNCFQLPWQVEKNCSVTTISVKAINFLMCERCSAVSEYIGFISLCVMSKVSIRSSKIAQVRITPIIIYATFSL